MYPKKGKEAVKDLEHRCYGEWLGELELLGLEKMLRGDLSSLYNSLNTYLFPGNL